MVLAAAATSVPFRVKQDESLAVMADLVSRDTASVTVWRSVMCPAVNAVACASLACMPVCCGYPHTSPSGVRW